MYLLWAGRSFFREALWRVALKVVGGFVAVLTAGVVLSMFWGI